MHLRLFLTILRTRLFLILFTFVITVGTGAAITMMQPARYMATTFLVLSFNSDDPFDRAGIPAMLSSSYLATQLDIIRSRKVAVKTIELLELEKREDVRDAYLKSGHENISLTDWLASSLMLGLVVEPLRDSRVVSISYEAFDPQYSAQVANAYAQAFIATTLELTTEPARRNAEWFDQQLKVLRRRLEAAQARLTDFQRQKGIVALDERLGTETSRLNDLSKSAVQAQQETYDVRSRQLGENHPEYRRALERERAVLAALTNQKRSILELRSQRDELNALAREVEVEQQTYAATLESYYKTAMQSQFNQTNIAVLSPAIPPQEPSSPNVVMNMMGAIILGLFLGVVVAVGVELNNRRVRATKDVAEALETRVLGAV